MSWYSDHSNLTSLTSYNDFIIIGDLSSSLILEFFFHLRRAYATCLTIRVYGVIFILNLEAYIEKDQSYKLYFWSYILWSKNIFISSSCVQLFMSCMYYVKGKREYTKFIPWSQHHIFHISYEGEYNILKSNLSWFQSLVLHVWYGWGI